MPTYEYACRQCGEHVEVVQSFRDDPLTECGLCGGPLRKVFSAAGIIFKGSGYYVTDSRKAPGDAKPEEKSGEKRGDAKKGDAKPAGDSSAAPKKSPEAKSEPAKSEPA